MLPGGIGQVKADAGELAGNVLVRRTWPESAFNAGNTLAAAALAAFIGVIGHDSDALQDFRAALAGLVYLVVKLGLAVLPAPRHRGRPYLTLLRQALSVTWPAPLTLCACRAAGSVLADQACRPAPRAP